ncbi:hypothetical protein [Serratia marcescens]|nr:hypothetical protein [Serratia marcescens]
MISSGHVQGVNVKWEQLSIFGEACDDDMTVSWRIDDGAPGEL